MRAAWVISVDGTEEIFTHESGSAKEDALQSKLPRQVHNADQSHASERERLDADLGNWSNVHLRALITIVKYNVPDKVCLHWTFAFTFNFFCLLSPSMQSRNLFCMRVFTNAQGDLRDMRNQDKSWLVSNATRLLLAQGREKTKVVAASSQTAESKVIACKKLLNLARCDHCTLHDRYHSKCRYSDCVDNAYFIVWTCV